MSISLHALRCLSLVLLVGCEAAVSDADAARVPDASARADAQAMPDAGRDAPITPDAPSVAAMCPPAGPFGTRAGDISPDFTLTDCDGNTHTLHELCEKQVTWLFEFADWCPPCRTFAMSRANTIYDANVAAHGDAFAGWMVISETSDFGPPSAATCATIRDRYGIHMPVLFDPTGAMQDALGVPANEVQVVLTEGARIDWVGRYAGSEVAARIESAY
jgi:peroxiredoxin